MWRAGCFAAGLPVGALAGVAFASPGVMSAAVGALVGAALLLLIGSGLGRGGRGRSVAAAAQTGAAFVELHTGAFANAYYGGEGEAEARRVEAAAAIAQGLGLTVNLGHGINYTNIERMRGIPGIHEMNIGHSILSRALFTGVREAVREMKARMNGDPLS